MAETGSRALQVSPETEEKTEKAISAHTQEFQRRKAPLGFPQSRCVTLTQAEAGHGPCSGDLLCPRRPAAAVARSAVSYILTRRPVLAELFGVSGLQSALGTPQPSQGLARRGLCWEFLPRVVQ